MITTKLGLAWGYSPGRDSTDDRGATLVVGRPRTATIAAQNSITNTLAVALVIGAILAILIAIILGRSITVPLLAVVNTADKLAAGDLSQRVNAQSHDELGRWGSPFNQMAEKRA